MGCSHGNNLHEGTLRENEGRGTRCRFGLAALPFELGVIATALGLSSLADVERGSCKWAVRFWSRRVTIAK